jgi:Holliday junction resolvasome RuvABC endonuclease subunit
MKILGVDLGKNGAAVLINTETGEILTWTWALTGDRIERARALLDTLNKIFEVHYDLDIVFYERPFARGAAATRSLWGMAGILEAVAPAAVLDATPSQIKEFATGNGKADKEEMIEAARQRGYHATTEHAADAYHAALYAQAHYRIGG